MIWKLLDWLCARWLKRYEGDLPVATTATVTTTATVVPFKKPVQPSPAFISNEQRVDTVHTPNADERLGMGSTPLADALAKPIVLPDVPKQTVTVKGEWEQQTGNYGVGVEADVDVGQKGGWSVGGKGGWGKLTGGVAAIYAQWKGKR
jgi:hypothetical protein